MGLLQTDFPPTAHSQLAPILPRSRLSTQTPLGGASVARTIAASYARVESSRRQRMSRTAINAAIRGFPIVNLVSQSETVFHLTNRVKRRFNAGNAPPSRLLYSCVGTRRSNRAPAPGTVQCRCVRSKACVSRGREVSSRATDDRDCFIE